jgi:hypothetical protein
MVTLFINIFFYTFTYTQTKPATLLWITSSSIEAAKLTANM